MTKPKILTIDMETKPALAYVWGLWDQNIGLSQLVAPSAPICFAAKFLGDKTVHFASDWDDGHEAMIAKAHALIEEADAVVTYNGDSFDLKKFRGEFLLNGMKPPAPTTSIDLLKTMKRMGFQSGKLAYVGPFLDIGRKVKNEGFELWSKVMDGDKPAQKRMKTYCIGDVTLTEKLCLRILPYITNHPHLGDTGGSQCGACQSFNVQSRGYRRTKAFKIQRLQCNDCGSWSDGKRTKV